MGADLRDVGKAKGFLIWTASAGTKPLPPSCPVRVQMPGMHVKERICVMYSSQGCYCVRGEKNPCPLAHVNSFKQIPDYGKAAFQDYVAKTKGLEFVPGQGPLGTKK